MNFGLINTKLILQLGRIEFGMKNINTCMSYTSFKLIFLFKDELSG